MDEVAAASERASQPEHSENSQSNSSEEPQRMTIQAVNQAAMSNAWNVPMVKGDGKPLSGLDRERVVRERTMWAQLALAAATMRMADVQEELAARGRVADPSAIVGVQGNRIVSQ